MKCSEATEAILSMRGAAVVVSTMSAIKHVDRLSPDGLNIACVPLMGGASALGLGLAIARPERTVVVLDGDGSVLMQLGSLVTTSELKPKNFVHFVFNNGVWFENLANLPVPAGDRLDYAGLARAAGIASSKRIVSVSELLETIPQLLATDGPHFVELKIVPDQGGVWNEENLQPDLHDVHFTRMASEAKRLRTELASQT